IHTPNSRAEIYLQGAHVTHFQRHGEEPILFLSAESKYENGQAIRGGIPIIFPWFGAKEGKPMHGFARNQAWSLQQIINQGDSVTLRFKLPESDQSAAFPRYAAEYFVTVSGTLSMELQVSNHSQEDFVFDNCLHTYFTVGEIGGISVSGLKGADYLDKVE